MRWFLAAFALAVTLGGGYKLATLSEVSFALRLLVCLTGTLTVFLVRKALRPPLPSQTYGSAGFAAPEMWKAWQTAEESTLPAGSVLLGKKDRTLLALPPPFPMQHGIIVGGSGTGKSFSFFLPNMAFGRGVSCVVTDPKSELWHYTSGFHSSTRYAPEEPDASACFNWIPLCREARMASLCARAIVEGGETQRQEAPWPDLETAFLAALFAHTSTTSVPTPLTAYRLLTRLPPADLMALFLTSDSSVAREQAVIFEQTHERMRGSITPVLAAKLQFLRDDRVARFTSASLSAPDLGKLRIAPAALYWCVREQSLALLRPLSALFFTLLLEQLAGETGEGAASVPVHLYLDEFANIGIIPHYATTISLARGRGLSLWHGIQSLSQLEASYGKANAQTILTNCATKIALSGLDVVTTDYFSRSLGERTVSTPHRTWQKPRFALLTRAVSDSVQEHARPLLTADEIRRLPQEQALVIAGNKRPLLLEKYRYTLPPQPARTTALGPACSLPVPVPSPVPLHPSGTLPSHPLPSSLPEGWKLTGTKSPLRKGKRARTTTFPKQKKHS